MLILLLADHRSFEEDASSASSDDDFNISHRSSILRNLKTLKSSSVAGMSCKRFSNTSPIFTSAKSSYIAPSSSFVVTNSLPGPSNSNNNSSAQNNNTVLCELIKVLPDVSSDKLQYILDLCGDDADTVSNLFFDGPGLSLSPLLKLMKRSLLYGDVTRVTIEENDMDQLELLTDSAFAFYKVTHFDPTAEVRVRIQNQPAVDTGGVRRQYFNDVFSHISNNCQHLFEGLPSRIRPTYRQSSISSGLINIVGKMVGHSVVMDGQGFPYFSPTCYYYMAGCNNRALSEISLADAGENVSHVISMVHVYVYVFFIKLSV